MNSKSERESAWSASGLALTIVGEGGKGENIYRRAMAIICEVMMRAPLRRIHLGELDDDVAL